MLFRSCRQLDAAISVADDTPVGFSFWWKGEARPPSRSEHLARHKTYVESILVLGREIGLHFALHGRFEQLSQDAAAYLADTAVFDMLHADLHACREVLSFIDRLAADYPETGKMAIANWRKDYERKIEQLENWEQEHSLISQTNEALAKPLYCIGK